MKRKLKLVILMMVSLGIATSCKKENPDIDDDNQTTTTSNPSASKVSMSSKVNGAAWQATENSFQNTIQKVEDNNGNKGNRLDIQGTSSNSKTISLTVKDFSSSAQGDGVAVRTYKLDNNPGDDALFAYGLSYVPVEGKINVTAVDATKKIISGTFEFKAYNASNRTDTLRVTEGVFKDISYTVF